MVEFVVDLFKCPIFDTFVPVVFGVTIIRCLVFFLGGGQRCSVRL